MATASDATASIAATMSRRWTASSLSNRSA
jgi:hypothetical protein